MEREYKARKLKMLHRLELLRSLLEGDLVEEFNKVAGYASFYSEASTLHEEIRELVSTWFRLCETKEKTEHELRRG